MSVKNNAKMSFRCSEAEKHQFQQLAESGGINPSIMLRLLVSTAVKHDLVSVVIAEAKQQQLQGLLLRRSERSGRQPQD